ncbi:MAG: hypothetical protein UX04_C0003G0047 [Microgenomates group bacterium GW2011_GWF2_45_18]|nr:MAG: hypothetical protein UW18_C0002G0047 [Microgenomates group bacterium GW2011_GWF1_44_10]KKU01775.1 MAG: hypothetical protein UX04_C0003G0047 [Microgenomates group bacterium GW2011_GWF2_45_18]OGJ41490.1 MAG: hypothetical protein A2378_04420 [Candidatus Pacebacteria bacterium RIFOXYB1_FULL_44_10]
MKTAGFTMIELLVVIAVIGALATAVLSSINPIEQINKGRDTRMRSDAAQLINAVDRYYASAEKYPWNEISTDGETAPTEDNQQPTVVMPDTAGEFCGVTMDDGYGTALFGEGACRLSPESAWLDLLSTSGEVKSGYISRLENQENYMIFAYKPEGSDATMYACFMPSSGAFKREAIRNCVNSGYETGIKEIACPNGDGDGNYGIEDVYVNELLCLP